MSDETSQEKSPEQAGEDAEKVLTGNGQGEAAKPGKAAKAPKQPKPDDGLIEMVKLGHEPIRLHKDCVQDHIRLGWSIPER